MQETKLFLSGHPEVKKILYLPSFSPLSPKEGVIKSSRKCHRAKIQISYYSSFCHLPFYFSFTLSSRRLPAWRNKLLVDVITTGWVRRGYRSWGRGETYLPVLHSHKIPEKTSLQGSVVSSRGHRRAGEETVPWQYEAREMAAVKRDGIALAVASVADVSVTSLVSFDCIPLSNVHSE